MLPLHHSGPHLAAPDKSASILRLAVAVGPKRRDHRHMSETIPVDVVRVFTAEDGSLGNELGIVLASPATAGHEQEITKALGFSETVFIGEIAEGIATMRIFTPAVELPFAGHPTVGAAWWLAQRGTPVDALDVAAGLVGTRVEGDTAWVRANGDWAPQFDWHELDSVEEVDALRPDAVTSGHHYFYAWTDEPAGALRSRMFAPAMGVEEDQATGAAAVRLTWNLGRDLDITQGLGARISTHLLDAQRVELSGRVVADRRISI